MLATTVYSPNQSVWFVLSVLPLVHPIVPFIEVLGAPALGVTTGGISFCSMVPQGGLTILGGMADICTMGVAVILYLPPSWLVASCWVVGT